MQGAHAGQSRSTRKRDTSKGESMRVLLVCYDNDSFSVIFPQGLAAVAAVLQQEGYEVSVWDQDVNHLPSNALTEYLDNNEFDVLGISLIAGYWQYQKLLELSKAIAESKNRPSYYILGGYGPAPEPEFFLKKTNADIVVIGEGEDTTRELFSAIVNNQSVAGVNGIAYRDGNQVIMTPERALIPEESLGDPDRVPMPAYDLFDMSVYRLMREPNCRKSNFIIPLLSGRGCPFKCNFCFRLDKGHRKRSVEAILDEIGWLMSNYQINYFQFSDDLLMTSKRRTVEIAEAFLHWQEKNKKRFKWSCNGRLNFVTPEVLHVMEKSGCVFINYGIEAFDDESLKAQDKALTCATIERGVQETIKTSIAPGLNFIWGNIGETEDTLQKAVDFLTKYDSHSQLRTIRPVTPYPGSPLYYHCIEKGLLDRDNPAEDFYERKHLNSDLLAVNLTPYSDDEFHAILAKANKTLLDNYFDYQRNRYHEQTDELYFETNTKFRGYRQGNLRDGMETASEDGVESSESNGDDTDHDQLVAAAQFETERRLIPVVAERLAGLRRKGNFSPPVG